MEANISDKRRRMERRAVAKVEYSDMTRKIQTLTRCGDLGKIQDFVRQNLDKSDDLYKIVKKTLDGTSYDSKHIRELLNLCQETSKRINVTSRPVEMKTIIQGLIRQAREQELLKTRSFLRYIAEEHISRFLCNPPTFEFFYGALRSEDLVIKERKRRVREKLVESQAITAKEKDIAVDVEQDTTPKEVEYINKQINKKAKEKPNGMSFFEFVVDPDSFTQTVENIFHLSFLVKEGKVGVKQDSVKKALLTVEDNNDTHRSQEERAAKGSQSILSFSMDDYHDWISKFNITGRTFPPRGTADNGDDIQ